MSETEPTDKKFTLTNRTADYVATASKAVLGAVPFLGSLLAEVAGSIIPNQRVDRIARFAAVLEGKLSHLEKDFIRAQLTDENFTDVLEESIRQAARSTTEERRAYIASVIVTGLTDENTEFVETKHLLRILGEINDIEVLWLRFHLVVSSIGGETAFREKNKNVFGPVFGSSAKAFGKATLQESYKQHLAQLNLLSPRYRIDSSTNALKFDSFTAAMKISDYHLAPLGELLLSHLGFKTEYI